MNTFFPLSIMFLLFLPTFTSWETVLSTPTSGPAFGELASAPLGMASVA